MESSPGIRVNRINGVVVGIVIDNNDPQKMYRVKVKFPWVSESDANLTNAADQQDFPSTWARVTTMMAGPDRGVFWLPEVDDEVLVAFEHGDLRRPIVIGSLWNKVDPPIHGGGDGANDFRTFFSRSGHVIQFQDGGSSNKERIVIQTKVAAGDADKDPTERGGHFILIDHSDGQERIEVSDGERKVFVLVDSTNQKVAIHSEDGDIEVSAPNGTITLNCKKLRISASSTGSIQTDSSLKIKAGSTATIESSSAMTIKGSVVKIN